MSEVPPQGGGQAVLGGGVLFACWNMKIGGIWWELHGSGYAPTSLVANRNFLPHDGHA